ncbi:MAG: hypothetical protein M1819_001205 [Sarea resinae]|nr:MAG: hypothetical protein M1819_001205 [Sarea resinae]
MSTSRTTAVSAPGKVLLTGGYLVLDRHYTGLVFGLDARIHVHVKPLSTIPGVSLSEIIVRSPQFRDAEWRYGYRLAEHDGGIEVTQLKGSSTTSLSRNPFVETALSYALTYVSSLGSPNFEPSLITILADNDYYSQPNSNSTQIAGKGDRFINFHVPLYEAHKTGLGSSAALVTAFTAGILAHYAPQKDFISTDAGKAILHNLAQAAHCAAQGKVGSGFDVAAAVYGSSVYRRFSPSILEALGEKNSSSFATRLKDVVENSLESAKWDTEIIKSAVSVPRGVRLVMCDVDCGSQTVGMVKKLLSWRKENPKHANDLWSSLQQNNEALSHALVTLARRGLKSDDDLQLLRTSISDIRSLIREMSTAADVPIEPKSQTDLLDACSQLPGVVGGVVPGAGGFDAVALLIKDKEEVLLGLQKFLEDWKVTVDDSSAGSRIGRVRLLGVRQDMEGVRMEKDDEYGDWTR